MSGSNKLESADYRLKNLTNALYLTGTNDVALRTGITGDIIIEGNVNVPGNIQVYSSPDDPVHVHLTELGTYGNLTSFVPVKGTVSVNNFPTSTTITSGNLSIYSGNIGIYGNIAGITSLPAINIASLPEVEIKNDTGNPIPISANTTVNSANNRIFVSMETDVTVADSNYEMNVARGLVTDQYLEFKNGYCASMTSGEKTIWSQASAYPWSSWTTAQRLYIISDSASDTGQTIYIEGLDASYNTISTTVTTNGITAVQTSISFLRINHVYITAGPTNVGMITQRLTSGTGTVIGGMYPGNARNKQGVFTVPAGYTAYILYGDVTSYKNGQGQVDGQIDMFVRTSQSAPFMNVFAGIASNGQYRNEFKVPLAAPQYSDIDVRFNPSGTCTVSCNWQMIMIAN